MILATSIDFLTILFPVTDSFLLSFPYSRNMNNYVVAKNAVIATALVMLFMLSLQPEYISRAILGVSNAVTSRFVTQDINAAERKINTDDQREVILNSVTLSFPAIEGYEIEKNENAAILEKDGESQMVITVEEYGSDAQAKAVSLSQSLGEDGQVTGVRVQPVMRGSNLYYEVSSNEQSIHYAVKRVSDKEMITFTPSMNADRQVVNKILSEAKFVE